MISPTFKFTMQDFKRNFFDKTERCVDRNLRRLAGTVRTIDRRSQKERPGPSSAESPPHAHTRLLKDFTFFARDPLRKSFVVGPAKLNIRGNAPEALEHGGKSSGYVGFGVHRHIEEFLVRRRPHTNPALRVAMSQLDRIFKDSLVSHSFVFRGGE